ncbi:PHP domain-containing protein [Desulfovibrio mangrovi]|uniref:PHP domain-containing protein n=1 Tax=Desulfovibrio mangrovi TaxID=2976983 RepID=UPI002246F786|nr:PHP domain-containing protein [Desulfovibrio mangrovi]UZP65991.1 PHP domain-containing protein [Desulfovibrio mangrovi]
MTRTYIDLHTHSTASDGSDTPEELIVLAHKAGVTTLALTDHDTTDGLEEAMDAGRKLGVNVIPGCELSVRTEYGELHIVGLWLNPEAPKLRRAMQELQDHRTTRNVRIVEKLQELNIPITYDEVLQVAGTGSVGRPHIAHVLIQKGFAHSMYNAFEVYLGDKGLAHVPKKVLSPKEGVELLKEEGATVSLAHMFLHGYPREWLEDMIATLSGFGMDAIEAYHSEHDDRSTRKAVDLAARHGLALTGGSDYHGAIKPDIRLGRGKGGLYVPPFVLADLIELRKSQGLPV